MTLFGEVTATLEERHSAYAVIGAAALAARGVSRSTFDLDLLTTDAAVLRRDVWSSVEGAGGTVDVRRGDAHDPLVGVVRFSRGGERPVDLIVGEGRWQERVLAEAGPLAVLGTTVPVVDEAGIILLKLYAGGLQDRWDIRQVLAAVPNAASVVRAVSSRLYELPERCRAIWDELLSG